MADRIECDVVIVGLGPTGATLANVLGQYGRSVVGLEREQDVCYSPRAVHFDDEVMRVFQSIGLTDVVRSASEPFCEMEFALTPSGKAILRARVGSQDLRYGHAGAWWFHQPTLERQLRDSLLRFTGVTTRYGVKVIGVTQDAGGVTATAIDTQGRQCVVRGRYLIGCDGGRSIVRSHAQLALESAGFDQPWVVVDAKARCGGKEPTLPQHHRQICDPRQPTTYVPVTGPHYRWEFMVMDDSSEQEATDPVRVRKLLAEFVDLDKIELVRIAYYKFHAVWARRWRKGRIILAGDAAHQMPPFLGQGMCSGIRDAHALGWRLDLILSAIADERLLDSYEQERCQHVRDIIHGAVFLGRIMHTKNRAIALLRNWLLFRPVSILPPLQRWFLETANRKRPLPRGLIGSNCRELAGHLVVQPRVHAAAAAVLLDTVLGNHFTLLSRRGCLDAAAVDRLCQIIPLKHAEFCEIVRDDIIGDTSRSLTQWFAAHQVDFVLIRPDRYCFDAGKAHELANVVDQFRRCFPTSGIGQQENRRKAI